MDLHSILTKTAQGLTEVSGKTSLLSRSVRNILREVDGRTSLADLAGKRARIPAAELLETMKALEKEGFVRELPRTGAAPAATPAQRGAVQKIVDDGGADLDFTRLTAASPAQPPDDSAARQAAAARAEEEASAKAKAEAEAAVRENAEAEARRAAADAMVKAHQEAKARLAEEAKAKAEAEERARHEALEQLRREAEAKARSEADEQARREAEKQVRLEAEAKARSEADELRRKVDEARKAREELARKAKEEAERAVREAEERVRTEAAAGTRREAEEQRMKLEEEHKAREEAERRARETQELPILEIDESADDRARREDEERGSDVARRFKEEQARRAAARQEAERTREAEQRRRLEEERASEEERAAEEERQKRRDDEEERRRIEEENERRLQEEQMRAREEEHARAREEAEKTQAPPEASVVARPKPSEQEAAAKAPSKESAARVPAIEPPARPPGRMRRRGGRIGALLFLVLLGVLIAAHFMPLDAAPFERAATARFGTPVRIGSVHLSLLPMPALRFDRVAIGPSGEVKIAAATANVGVGALLDKQKVLGKLELDGARVPVSWLAAGIWGKGQSDTLHVERVIARGLKIEAQGLELPPVNVDAKLDAGGGLQSVLAETSDRKQTLTIAMKNGTAAVDLTAEAFQLPFPGAPPLDSFSGNGTLSPSQLTLSKFAAGALGGSFTGNARLRWGANWSLEGEFSATSMNPARVAAKLVPTGRLDGKGTFSMRAATPEKLHDAARLDCNFTVHRGTLGFVDLTGALQGSTAGGGTTAFQAMDGNASFSGGSVHVRQVRLAAGLLNATGEARVDPQKNLSGRVHVELTSQTRGGLSLGGTVDAPQVKR